ncbi:MAG: MalY/PatB family protein [Acidimicrobiia bacterium]
MSTHAERLRSRGGLKWTFYDEDVLPAWVAEMDFAPAPAVSRALHEAVDKGLTGYPYPEAEQALATAAVDFWADWLDWKVEPSWVFPAPDVIAGIGRAIEHLTRPGSPVVLHTPVYFPFFSMVEQAGRDLIEVRCQPDDDGRYTLNLAGIDRALDEGAGSVVLCNPWNPTGRCLTESELADLLEVAGRHDARVISDEIHAPITYSGARHVPLATLDSDRTVTVTAASKAWDLPGLKCAQVVLTNGNDREKWERQYAPYQVGVGTFGLLAGIAAYSDGVNWLEQTLKTLESTRDLLASLVEEHLPGAGFSPPEGTYLAWLDLSGYDVDDPAEFLLERARVALMGGGPFGTGASRHVRLNFATDPAILTMIMERMGRALSDA